MILRNSETVNGPAESSGDRNRVLLIRKSVVLDYRPPAEWATMREVLQRRRQKEAKEQQREVEKHQNAACREADTLERNVQEA